LMTLHLAKGLEFEYVFMTGMEEGLFPIGEAVYDDEELEEERRLCYVGITRTKNRLFLTHTASRKLFGQKRWNIPSRFLSEAGFFGDSSVLEPSPSLDHRSPPQGFAIGDKIVHPDFGDGEIIGAEGAGESYKVTVLFDSGIWKKLLVKYAPIEKR
ncbi:MAG: hypothetical protein GF384_06705, partial [Elusimicrobia bacterium]|nr:hypothetical protein [Elusimicrobiota bacterium]MBD3412394.1 hypothetical protein [Elusimicrobiota bacterium]